MRVAIVLLAILLASCQHPATNEYIVKQAKYCQANGLDPQTIVNIDGVIVDIQCFPKTGGAK